MIVHDWRDWYEERCAIIEYEGTPKLGVKVSRTQAELLAWLQALELYQRQERATRQEARVALGVLGIIKPTPQKVNNKG